MPVIELGHLSPAQKRAYVIADNRLALDAGWDDEQVARWLSNRLFRPWLVRNAHICRLQFVRIKYTLLTNGV